MDSECVQPNGNDDEAEHELEPILDDDEPEIGPLDEQPGNEGHAERDSDNEDEDDEELEDEHLEYVDLDDEDDDQQQTLGGSLPDAPPADLEALVHYVVSKLVAEPESIEISSEQRGGTMYIALRVPETDLGRVIGREGRTAKAIRTLVSIAGSKSNVHARLDIDG